MKQDMDKHPVGTGETSPVSRANIWRLWMDNLKEWHWFRKENPHWLRDLIHHAVATGRKALHVLHLDVRHQVNANRHRQFPESESGFVQLILFIGGSIPRRLTAIRDRFTQRRKKRIHAGDQVRAQLEKIKLHPVIFLGAALVVAALCVLLSLYTIGTSVSYDGRDLGTVSGAGTVSRVVANLEDVTRETLELPEYQINRSLLTTDSGLVSRRSVESKEEFSEKLSRELDMVDYAYVLYVDDEPVVATTFPGAIEELLEQLKIGYIGPDTVDCHFVEKTEIREEYVDADYVMNLGYVAEILNDTKTGEVTYTVEAGDAPLSIASKFDISLDDLYAANPGYDFSVLRVDDVLTISNAVPYLTVVNVERQCYVSDIPYEVEYQDDDSMYQGDYKVLSAGVFGKSDVTANVTYVNGEETARQVVASATLSEPVTELQARGTKERPSWFPTGSFHWPCNGTLTSRFGYRNTGIRGASTYHEGIDIANGKGTPIYASDGGTVKHAGWMGGYGYLVIIDHGNGYQTYYGHNSSLLVSVGDHVYQGQQIAKMGSTGVSSGSHCDFRIKINGTFVNPLNYL